MPPLCLLLAMTATLALRRRLWRPAPPNTSAASPCNAPETSWSVQQWTATCHCCVVLPMGDLVLVYCKKEKKLHYCTTVCMQAPQPVVQRSSCPCWGIPDVNGTCPGIQVPITLETVPYPGDTWDYGWVRLDRVVQTRECDVNWTTAAGGSTCTPVSPMQLGCAHSTCPGARGQGLTGELY
jgi:hypothetical protein